MKLTHNLLALVLVLTLFSCGTKIVQDNFNYGGYKFGGGVDTVGPVANHTEPDDTDYATNIDIIVGKEKGKLRYGLESGIANRSYHSDKNQAITIWDNTIFLTYDFIKGKKWTLYGGVGAGLGLPITHEKNYPLVTDSGLYGSLDYRFGIRTSDNSVRFGGEFFIEYKMEHISDPFESDPGSNSDLLLIGFTLPIHFF